MDLRQRGEWSLEEHNRAIAAKAGERLEKVLPQRIIDQLGRLRAAQGHPYLLLKAASFSGPLFPASPADYARRLTSGKHAHDHMLGDHRHSQLEANLRACDTFAAGLLHLLGAQPEFRIVGAREPLVRDMVTDPLMPELNDRSTRDMPLRFHTSTTEKDLPGDGAGRGDGFVSNFKIITTMWNYRRIPVYLLSVDDLLAALPEGRKGQVIETLQKPIFDKIGPRADIGVSARTVNDAPLLHNMGTPANPDWVMSFDPGRVWADDDPEGREALLILRDTLRWVSRTEAVREIRLRRRDILIVDNMRALVTRRENPGGFRDALAATAAGPRRRRWLRLMYGYPTTSTELSPDDRLSE